ncbi:MAG: (Fe-S)-binding protein [Aeropyrum sp.]|nr:(Fe-S)-binding protein [Aeropyrum sp.]MCE4616938.1 (Fe-S)-binding protein [Aeropyrum sp.]
MPKLRIYLDMLKVIVEKTGLPVPAPNDVIYRWSRSVSVSTSGEAYLFTGGLYQLSPYIRATVSLLERVESLGLLGVAHRFRTLAPVGLARVLVRPPKTEIRRAESIVVGAYRILSSLGVAYKPKGDMYSGAILYENGLDETFQNHISKVHKRLRDLGIKRIVTIDPHTTHIMRSVAPKYVDGYDIEVESYLELLDRKGVELKPVVDEAVIHDPCYNARFEGIIEEPRSIAARSGLRLAEPPRARRMTYCCGGPIEGLMPPLAKKIAATRAEELLGVSKRVVVMCPICMINLEKPVGNAGGEVLDLLEVLKT